MSTTTTPTLRLKSLQADLLAIKAKATAEGRDFTAEEMRIIESKSAEAVELKGKIERAEAAAGLLAQVGGTVDFEPTGHGGGTPTARSKGYMALSGAGAKSIASTLAAKVGTNPQAKSLAAQAPISLNPQSPIELGKVPASLLDILPVTQHDSPKYQYARQTVRTNNAAVVAPGAQKPTSVVSTQVIDGELQVVAHISEPIDEYTLKDADVLRMFLEAELRYMLLAAVENEVLNGDGSAGHLTGILNTSGVQIQTFDTDPVTTLRMAMLKAENVGHQSSALVIHPQDWANIETTRTATGTFDLGTAVDRAAQKLWGVPVVTSNQLTPGEAVSLDLATVGLDTDTFGIQVQWSNAAGFETNEVKARVEGRWGVSVYQPLGVVKATLTDAAA